MALHHHARNSKGFSLVELMIAIVIIAVTMLALLTTLVTSMRTNLENEVRNNGVRITNSVAEVLLALPFTDDSELSDGSHTRSSSSTAQDQKGFPPTLLNIRGTQQAYTMQWAVSTKTAKLKEITITVSYTFANRSYSSKSVIYKHEAI